MPASQIHPPRLAHETPPKMPARETLPTMYDLPSEEIGDPGMPDEFHFHQASLLDETFRPPAVSRDEVFSAVDMNLYYDWRHPTWYKRPDWFGVTGVSRLYAGHDSRLSYVAWQESAPPLIIVELLSPGTEKEDLGQTLREANQPPPKWEVYEKILGVPYYAVFSRGYTELRIFRLTGAGYVEVIGHGGRYWIPEAGLGLGIWRGSFHGFERLWLRWFDATGNVIPTSHEIAEQERQEAERERKEKEWERKEKERERKEKEVALAGEARQRKLAEQAEQNVEQERRRAEQAEQAAEQERLRAAHLADFLRQLGHDPDSL
ncbi:MAG: Uma2 family endonuclease [Acidobacteriota bacterium]